MQLRWASMRQGQYDREFKESHRIEMVQHHKARNAEDPEWCLKEVWRDADEACADVLLLTDFRTQEDYQWFLEKCGGRGNLVLLRIEADSEARLKRGWRPDPAKDLLYSETDLDNFLGWDACFDNSSNGAGELVAEWISRTVVPRVLSHVTSGKDVSTDGEVCVMCDSHGDAAFF